MHMGVSRSTYMQASKVNGSSTKQPEPVQTATAISTLSLKDSHKPTDIAIDNDTRFNLRRNERRVVEFAVKAGEDLCHPLDKQQHGECTC